VPSSPLVEDSIARRWKKEAPLFQRQKIGGIIDAAIRNPMLS
jgi:hypothetical protein